MAAGKKARQIKAGKGPPVNWTPYLIAGSVIIVVLAVYSAVYSTPAVSDGSPGASTKPKKSTTSRPVSASPPKAPVKQLEAQLRALHSGLSRVAATGQTGVFKKIGAMADTVNAVLDRASADGLTEDERRDILQEGLESKAEMLLALTDYSTKIKEEDAEENAKHAPLALDPAGNVAKLTKESFPTYIAKNPRSMVEFYAPWCGHCKKLAPQYEQVAKDFKGRAGFAAVDATEEEQLARIYKVSGYPTLKWFIHGKSIDYEGPREAGPISKWVEDHLKPAYNEMEEEDLANSLDAALQASAEKDSEKHNMAIVGCQTEKDTDLFKAFEFASEKFRNKLLFVWARGASDTITFHRVGREQALCSGCTSDDEVVAWLEESLNQDDMDDFNE